MRLDQYLVQGGWFSGRDRAKEALAGKKVLVNGKPVTKPSAQVDENTVIEIVGEVLPYVSRGGLKLEKALKVFDGLEAAGKRVLDIGASTGGFTDCLLQHGAEFVWAVDVGTGQLAESLRNDPRVRSMENTNAKDLTAEDLDGEADGIVMDVSFVSITKLLPYLHPLVHDGAFLMALIKPQFEAGPQAVGKHGVVRDASVHERVIREILEFLAGETPFGFRDLAVSPIHGQEGNNEFLLYAVKNKLSVPPEETEIKIRTVLAEAHKHTPE